MQLGKEDVMFGELWKDSMLHIYVELGKGRMLSM
jgi:hypothetical protein